MKRIEIVDYDPQWPALFERLRAPIWEAVAAHAVALEHVGSTAVPGLAAKPIIDMDVVIASAEKLPAVIQALAALGYTHRGDLGIEGREAFECPPGLAAHHLYVCLQDSPALANHLAVRDRLRRDASVAAQYGLLKRQLMEQFPNDMDAYVSGKTSFLLHLLAEAGMDPAVLKQIRRANRRPTAVTLTLRYATLEDLPLLTRWDTQPHVIAAHAQGAWGNARELAQPPHDCLKLIACIDGRPIGFVQILDPARFPDYWGPMEEGLRAIDLWIGEPEDLGEGYGTAIMARVQKLCFAQMDVKALIVDPEVTNTRAHRFYERLGFRLVERRSFGDDECCIYRLERPE